MVLSVLASLLSSLCVTNTVSPLGLPGPGPQGAGGPGCFTTSPATTSRHPSLLLGLNCFLSSTSLALGRFLNSIRSKPFTLVTWTTYC